MRVRQIAESWMGVATVVLVAACDLDLRGALDAGGRVALPVHVETVIAEVSTPALVVPGVVEAHSARTLGFGVPGRIEGFLVGGGVRVERGDAIATLDRSELLRVVAAARAASDRALARLLETERRSAWRLGLLELAAVSSDPPIADRIAFALHAAEVRQTRAALEGAEERLAAAILRAPGSGVVGRSYRPVGDEVTAGEPVVRLIEIDRVTVRSAVPRALASLLRDGGEAVVRVGEGADAAVHRGSLRRLAANADLSGGLVSFELSVENPDHVLRPQMVVAVAVALESREAHFTVPLSSVRRGIDNEPFAFLVVGGEEALRVERRALGLGGLRGDRVSVVTGLRPGERVVTRGAELLTVGDLVTVVGEGP